MSQTPVGDHPSRDLFAYDKGWAALNLMLREGKSFSGRERNCAFMNLGKSSGRFANISAVSGLDLVDDGRGLAYTDWDFDGDLDLWTTARTGPRVRLLRNDFPVGDGPARWVALRLQGKSSNRDGIGARVELLLKGGERRLKTLSAGHGHLSQSSKWLHFGIGDAEGIDGAIVHWPGGKAERFGGVAGGKRFLLIQGSGEAQEKAFPEAGSPLDSAPLEIPVEGGNRRIVLLKPMIAPELKASTLDGHELNLVPGGKPILLNLWATWCAPCISEMKEWGEAKSRFEDAGLRVVSLSVDEPEANLTGKIKASVKKMGYPYEIGLPGEGLVNALNVSQLALIGFQGDLPVPSTFLIDSRGRLSVIYKGGVTSQQIEEDLKLLNADFDERLASAIPFAGRWIEKTQPLGSSKIAGKFALRGELKSAADCVEFTLARDKADPGLITAAEEASLHRIRGAVTMDLKRYEDSLESWKTVQRLNPMDRSAFMEMAKCHKYLGDFESAEASLVKALELRRSDPETLFELGRLQVQNQRLNEATLTFKEMLSISASGSGYFELANAQIALGKIGDAVQSLKQTLKLNPDWALAANNLAWILATCPEASIRDGAKAVELATSVCEQTKNGYPSGLSTLAAACAERGDFKSALSFIAKAIEVAREKDQPNERIEGYLERQKSYRAGQPYRDASLTPR